MSATTENDKSETKASDTPETKAKAKLDAKANDKPETKTQSDNYSCCGSCSD